jgi:hypothetical protein
MSGSSTGIRIPPHGPSSNLPKGLPALNPLLEAHSKYMLQEKPKMAKDYSEVILGKNIPGLTISVIPPGGEAGATDLSVHPHGTKRGIDGEKKMMVDSGIIKASSSAESDDNDSAPLNLCVKPSSSKKESSETKSIVPNLKPVTITPVASNFSGPPKPAHQSSLSSSALTIEMSKRDAAQKELDILMQMQRMRQMQQQRSSNSSPDMEVGAAKRKSSFVSPLIHFIILEISYGNVFELKYLCGYKSRPTENSNFCCILAEDDFDQSSTQLGARVIETEEKYGSFASRNQPVAWCGRSRNENYGRKTSRRGGNEATNCASGRARTRA